MDLLDQCRKWNDNEEYQKIIDVLEAISANERTPELDSELGRAYNNLADPKKPEGREMLQKAIELLAPHEEYFQGDHYWNFRMGYSYYFLDQDDNALRYFKQALKARPDDEDTKELIAELEYWNVLADHQPDENIGLRPEGSEEETEPNDTGAFVGFVLMSKGEWDKKQLIQDLKEKWDITVEESEDETHSAILVFDVGSMTAAISLIPTPVPNYEAEVNAENNYMWPEAVEVAKAHSAHIIVAAFARDEDDLLERGKLYTKLVAACCRQKYATGIHTSGVVFQPQFYEGFADMMKEDELPIFNWIWFGLYRRESGMCAYTYGMNVFGKDEMEVLDANADLNDLRDFLGALVSYVLESDAELQDGETIGFSEDDKHTITYSEGVALPDQMTLKISYESSEGDCLL